MFITGIGRTKFGILDKSLPEMLYEAMQKTLQDSPLKIEDIDAKRVLSSEIHTVLVTPS